MYQFYKKFSKTGIDLALLIVSVLALMFLFSYGYQIAAPVFIAVLIYLIVEPISKFLQKKGLKRKIATNLSMLFFILVLLSFFALLGVVFASQISNLAVSIPGYITFFQDIIVKNSDFLIGKINSIPPDVLLKIQEALTTLAAKFSSVISTSLTGIFNTISSVSTVVFNVLVGIILAYFLCLEVDDWKKFSKGKVPKTLRKATIFLKENVLSGFGKYIKAQLKLISFTFIIIFLGLVVVGADNALSIAFFSALLDIMPLLGIPVIFIPWMIYCLVVGKTGFAIYLLCLMAFTMIFRQIMEPKIAGDSLGVSAFTMLAAMMISLSVFGIGGLIITPILIILVKALIEQGYIRQWIRMPEDEFED